MWLRQVKTDIMVRVKTLNVCHISAFTWIMAAFYRRPKCFERIIQLHVTLQQNNTKRQSQHSARQFTVHLTVIMQI